MTDKRTSEPTHEQVETAAVASINSHRSRAGLPTLATLDGVPNADEWRDDARAALVAAQGAVPVLPSSGVDEYALSGVISLAYTDWRSKVNHWQRTRMNHPGGRSDFAARAVAEWMKEQGGEGQ